MTQLEGRQTISEWLNGLIRNVPDFPEPGIQFKDITPVLAEPGAARKIAQALAKPYMDAKVDLVVGIESRGFLFVPHVAEILNAGILLIRKAGKLPGETLQIEYELEYGSAALEVHKDQIMSGQRVLIIDDVLATGGTAQSAAELICSGGAEVAGFAFLIELLSLGGRKHLSPAVHTEVLLAVS